MRQILPLLTCLAVPVLADCPTAADMAGGVRLTDSNGETETFRRLTGQLVEGEFQDGKGGGAKYLLLSGTFVVQVFDTENGQPVAGTRVTTAYPVSADNPPKITPGDRWDVKAIVNDVGDIYESEESHIYGPDTEITIGACTYGMIPVFSVFRGDGGFEERLNYLPEFGFAYLVESRDQGQAPVSYHFVNIEALADN